MKSFPAIIKHHSLTFKLESKFRPDDMRFDLKYLPDVPGFPPVCAIVSRLEDTDTQVDETVAQIHAYVGEWLTNFFIISESLPKSVVDGDKENAGNPG